MQANGHALDVLGLGPDEEDAYRALLTLPDVDAAELARTLESTAERAKILLAALAERGLAKMTSDTRYVAVAPEASVVSLLADRLDALRRGYDAVGGLERMYRDAQARYGAVPGTETVRGAEAIRSRLGQMRHRAREQIRTCVCPPLATQDSGFEIRQEARERGVRFRTLYEKALLDDPAAMKLVRLAVSRGTHARFASTLPLKLLIVDVESACIVEMSDPGVALVTEHPALVTMAGALFEQVWPTAVPAPLNGDGDAAMAVESGLSNPDDRLLLSLLLAGLTDQAIAMRLGIGLRTVQRRVRDLMNAAEVDTRIQLGWQASRRGWVSD
ncbi:MAG: helix-turn-helix domain-containing protein [Stackebrandtia sp.]